MKTEVMVSEFDRLEGEAEKYGEQAVEKKLGMDQQGQQGQDQYGQQDQQDQQDQYGQQGQGQDQYGQQGQGQDQGQGQQGY